MLRMLQNTSNNSYSSCSIVALWEYITCWRVRYALAQNLLKSMTSMWCLLRAAISDAPQVAGLSPQELTQLNLDKTRLLEELIADEYGGNADIMLGELQVYLCPSSQHTSAFGPSPSHAKICTFFLRHQQVPLLCS